MEVRGPALQLLCVSALTAANLFAGVGEIDLNNRLAALGEPRQGDLTTVYWANLTKVAYPGRATVSELQGGSVVCRLFAVSQTEGGWDVLIRCFDAGTGKQVLQSPPVWTNSALQLFAGGGLIGVDDSGRPWSASSQPSRHMHALWSFATNSVTRRWPPEVDATGGPLGFAISLDGGLIAGTASGSVRISRLASPGEHR